MSSQTEKPTIHLLEPFPEPAIAHCLTLFNVVPSNSPEAANWRQNAEAILVRELVISAADISQAKRLKVIGKQGVGIDIIDQPACKARGIPVLNTPGANAQSVAELVLTLTMALARQLRTILVRQAEGREVRKEDCGGRLMVGSTVGVVGMGNVGVAVARLFQGAFGCGVVAWDPFAGGEGWEGVEYERVETLEDVLRGADVVTLHVPLTDDTRDMIAWPQLEMMKGSSFLINAARGGVVNEEDLLRALDEGVIAGAGLDCHVDEPPTLECHRRLWETGKVVSTPHIGATTAETQVHTAVTAMDRVFRYLTEGSID